MHHTTATKTTKAAVEAPTSATPDREHRAHQEDREQARRALTQTPAKPAGRASLVPATGHHESAESLLDVGRTKTVTAAPPPT